MDSRSFEIQQKKEVSAQIQRDIAQYLLEGGKITELPYCMESTLDAIPLTERQQMRLNSIVDTKRSRPTMASKVAK